MNAAVLKKKEHMIEHWPGELMSAAASCMLAFVLLGCEHVTLSTSIGIKFITVTVHIKTKHKTNQGWSIINQSLFNLAWYQSWYSVRRNTPLVIF